MSSISFMDESQNLIPNNTIVIFTEPKDGYLTPEQTKALIRRPSKKRDWFSPNFYRCLPLSIGNQYGFEILAPFSFNAIWDGCDTRDAVTFTFFESREDLKNKHPHVSSHFGHGIITFELSWTFRTPKGINLITINPPNHIIPNITVMTGVIETDNLQRDFTINLKIQEPHRLVSIKAGEPIVTILPIPRYFQDKFKLDFAEDIMTEEQIIPELQTWHDSISHRTLEYSGDEKRGVHYMKGVNIYNEPYEDHQGPNINYEA